MSRCLVVQTDPMSAKTMRVWTRMSTKVSSYIRRSASESSCIRDTVRPL